MSGTASAVNAQRNCGYRNFIKKQRYRKRITYQQVDSVYREIPPFRVKNGEEEGRLCEPFRLGASQGAAPRFGIRAFQAPKRWSTL